MLPPPSHQACKRCAKPQESGVKSWGHHFIRSEAGILACGYEGLGRPWPVELAMELMGKHNL